MKELMHGHRTDGTFVVYRKMDADQALSMLRSSTFNSSGVRYGFSEGTITRMTLTEINLYEFLYRFEILSTRPFKTINLGEWK